MCGEKTRCIYATKVLFVNCLYHRLLSHAASSASHDEIIVTQTLVQ